MIFLGPDPIERDDPLDDERQESRPAQFSELEVRAEALYDPDNDPHAWSSISLTRCSCGQQKPCTSDPWLNQCDRCEEWFEQPGCAHGRTLCPSCAPFACQTCETEEADAAARADEIRKEWYR